MTPAALAETWTVPAETAVTRPALSTLATDASELDQAKCTPPISAPAASNADAASDPV